MSMESHYEQEQPLAEVIPIRGRDNGVHRINGIKMNLGRMSLSELAPIRDNTHERFEDARFELALIDDYMTRATDGGDGAA